MQPIVAPLNPGDSGPHVANLIEGLLFSIERGTIRALAAPNRPTAEELRELSAFARREMAAAAFGDATRQLVMYFQVQQALGDNLFGSVEDRTVARLNETLKSLGAFDASRDFIVEGFVRRPAADGQGGAPVAGIAVHAFDQDVAGPTRVGQGLTDAAGKYRISFAEQDYLDADVSLALSDDVTRIFDRVRSVPQPDSVRSGPDIWVGIPAEGGAYPYKSETLYNAGLHTSIDLILPEAPAARDSELERLLRLIVPRLKGLALRDLTEQQLDFLSKDADVPLGDVRRLVAAATLVNAAKELAQRNETELEPFEFHVFAAAYAFRHVDSEIGISGLLASGAARWRATVAGAVKLGRIPQSVEASIENVVDLLTRLRAWVQLEPQTKRSMASLGDLLQLMPTPLTLNTRDQRLVASLLDKNPRDLGVLKTELEAKGWGRKEIHGVIRTIGLGDVADGHAPLVAALQQSDPDERGAALLDLAAYGRADWRRVVERTGVPATLVAAAEQDPKDGYVDRLMRNVELRMPSAVVATRIGDGRIPVDEKVTKPVLMFLENNPAFRFGDDSILGQFLQPSGPNLDGILDEEIPLVRDELMRVERVARVSPNLEVAEHLLAAGYGSARQVVRRNREVFVDEVADRLPGSRAAAAEAYDTAAGVVATATGLLLGHSPMFDRGPKVAVMPDVSAASNGDEVISGPVPRLSGANALSATIETLFGSQDYCECDGCSSMYSPAAYLVELFQMLDGGPKNGAGKSPLDVLLTRRPDLAEIELTCDNSDVTLPYIDLVLEVLESALAQDAYWNRFARGDRNSAGQITDWGFDAALDQGGVPQQLRNDLRDAGIDLGDSPTATTLPSQPDKRWVVRGNGWRLLLMGTGNPAALKILIYPQSKAGASSDEVLPRQYVYWAYEPLQVSRFPWTLPFDLSHAETLAWLERLNVKRREIVDAYSGPARWSSAIAACEVLGIGEAEKPLFLAASVQPHSDWGFAQPLVFDESFGGNRDWFQVIRQVSLFRRRSGTTHRALLQLLETRFIQTSPGLAGPLRLSGDECNSDKMLLGNDLNGGLLTPSVLRRFCLFIRLQRKLGWSTLDLDRAIRAFSATAPVVLTAPISLSSEEHFTEGFLTYLANVVRLRTLIQLPIDATINLFRTKFDTLGYWDHSGSQPRAITSLYERLFNEPTVARPRAPGLELTASRDELRVIVPNSGFPRFRLSDYAAECAAALSCTPDDLFAVLPRGGTSLPPLQVGKVGTTVVDGEWVELDGAEIKQVELVLGQPSDAATEIRITVQEQSAAGGPVQAAPPIAVTKGTNDWRMVAISYAGAATRVRVRAERVSGAGSLWMSARVLTVPGLVADVFDLASLTRWCGHVRLGRALKMPAREYSTFIRLSGMTPLAGPGDALAFIDGHQKSRATGVTVPELNYLLRHRFASRADAEQETQRITRILSTFRARMQTEEAALSPVPGMAADLARRLLLEVGWPDRLVELVLGPELLDRNFPTAHVADLVALASAVRAVLPSGLAYDPTAQQLEFRALPRRATSELAAAVMTLTGTNEYLGLPGAERGHVDVALSALGTLTSEIDQALNPLLGKLAQLAQSIDLPTHRAGYAAGSAPAAASLAIPEEWTGEFWYDPADAAFKFRGPMTDASKDVLSNVSNTAIGSAYRNAIDALFGTASAYVESNSNRLVAREPNSPVAGQLTAELLLGELPSLEERSQRLLQRLIPAVRERRAKTIALEVIGDVLTLDPYQTAVLIDRFRHQDGGVEKALIAREAEDGWLLAASFAQSDPTVAIAPTAFPIQFRAIGRLLKLALIVSRSTLPAAEAEWLFGRWLPSAGLFDFALLPHTPDAAPAPLWPRWLVFATLMGCRSARVGRRPVELEAIREVLAGPGADGDKFEALAVLLGARSSDLARLADDLHASPASALLNPAVLRQALDCLDMMRRSGADAATLHAWSQPKISLASATQARQLARASIGEAQWATASRPVLDALRVRRRDALIDHRVHALDLRDANDLFGELLIDPEMGPCMMTSRVRQAISSVQLFIHRTLMNVEHKPDRAPIPPGTPDPGNVPSSAINTTHWEWMKNYRVWEANRKVLLYPENWIDPTLRVDKTSVFSEIEAQQSDGTATGLAAGALVTSYLTGLTDVSRLEVVSTCRETRAGADVVHMVGRTRSEPREYFYRLYSKPQAARDARVGTWTSWARIEVDLTSDPIPAIVRNQLHLFWLTFTETADENAEPIPTAARKPKKIWTVKLSWSVHANGLWRPKKEAVLWKGGDPDPDFQSHKWYFVPDNFSLVPRPESSAERIVLLLYGTKYQDYFWMNRVLAAMVFDGDSAASTPIPAGAEDSLEPYALYTEGYAADPVQYVFRRRAVHQIWAQDYDENIGLT